MQEIEVQMLRKENHEFVSRIKLIENEQNILFESHFTKELLNQKQLYDEQTKDSQNSKNILKEENIILMNQKSNHDEQLIISPIIKEFREN
jgi:hypothetical protein